MYTKLKTSFILTACLSLILSVSLSGQDSTIYDFDTLTIIPHSPVKDQHRSGTCWSFATVSFLESEILRNMGITTDLSEMFFVRKAYEEKVNRYVNLHGNTNLSPGGQAHDVTNVIRDYGILTEESYPGTIGDLEKHNHGELDAMINAMAGTVVKKRSGRLTSVWRDAIYSMLDVYLGEIPAEVEFQETKYSPAELADEFRIEAENYYEFTSYNHLPFNSAADLQIPDNWSRDTYYNIPLDQLEQLTQHALDKGYSLVWDGDVSEKGFMHKHGLAINPEVAFTDMSDIDKKKLGKYMVEEKKVDQKDRQVSYERQTSTDDHLMHLCGMAKDQNGVIYYLIKNSWGDDSNEKGGLLWMSSAYFREHTVAVMVHKDGIPKPIKQACNIQ